MKMPERSRTSRVFPNCTVFHTGFKIPSTKGFLGYHPPIPNHFKEPTKICPSTHLNHVVERTVKAIQKNGKPLTTVLKAMDDGRGFLGGGRMMTKMATSRY